MYASVNWIIIGSDNGFPDGKFHGANMGPIWGRQDPGGPHVGPMNFAIWVVALTCTCDDLLNGPLGINFREIWTKRRKFSFSNLYFKLKWRPFCFGIREVNVLTRKLSVPLQYGTRIKSSYHCTCDCLKTKRGSSYRWPTDSYYYQYSTVNHLDYQITFDRNGWSVITNSR